MDQWYKCPRCSENILYGTNSCPLCKCPLAWSQQGPIEDIEPSDVTQQQKTNTSKSIAHELKKNALTSDQDNTGLLKAPKKSIALRILLAIAAIAIGMVVQIIGAILVRGLPGLQNITTPIGFIVMGYLIYRWSIKG
jgi:hypothetical protein